MRAVGFRDRLSVDDDANVARARQRVHALEWIARVLENLFVLFHPLVHFGPIESKVVLKESGLGKRNRITPRGIFGASITDLNRPVRRLSFDRATALALA